MSSHHIVRDFQEPALLVADGEPCSFEILESLLEWSPVVVALDNAFVKLVSLGVKVDYWLGDFDNINPQKVLNELGQDSVKIIHAPNQDKTDFEKGIEFLVSLNAEAINIIWATGRRMDHTLGNFSSLTRYSTSVKLVMHDNFGRMYMLPKKFKKWFPKGQILSLIPAPITTCLTTKGLQYNVENECFEWGVRIGNSNESARDGQVEITFKEGALLLIETFKD